MVRSKWELLKKMVDFLSPFDVCTNLLGGENYTTANCVVPFIFDLEMHTESYKENEDNTIAGVAEELNMELKRRFGKYMMSDAEDFESFSLWRCYWTQLMGLCLKRSNHKAQNFLLQDLGSRSKEIAPPLQTRSPR